MNFVPTAVIILSVPSSHFYSFLADVEGYTAQMAALAVGAGLLWLRWTRPHLARPFKAFVPVVLLYLIVCVVQVILPFITLAKSSTGWVGGYASVVLAM